MKVRRRTRPLPVRTSTIIGMPPPLHLPAPPRDPEDTIVVDVEVNAAGQVEIVRASRP